MKGFVVPEAQRPAGFRPSRRSVVRGVVWTIPAVSVAAAAPAFALSPCAQVTLTWGAGTGTAGGVTASAVTAGASGPGNLTAGSLGGLPCLLFYSAVADNTVQTITITFTAEVASLSFSITDIDSASSIIPTQANYFDTVTLAGRSAAAVNQTYSQSLGSNIFTTSNGSTTPWQPKTANSPVTDTTANGNVLVTFGATSAVKTLTLVYRQTGTVNNSTPHIGISSLTFRPILC